MSTMERSRCYVLRGSMKTLELKACFFNMGPWIIVIRSVVSTTILESSNVHGAPAAVICQIDKLIGFGILS